MIIADQCEAELRGPGNRRRSDESENEYEMDLDQRTQGMGGRAGRIILLGDGTEVLTEGDDTQMFDHDEEDKDLDAQVSRGHVEELDEEDERQRSQREATPAPESQSDASRAADPNAAKSKTDAPDNSESSPIQASPISMKAVPDTTLPEKLVTPDRST